MDTHMITADYVSKYIRLLNKFDDNRNRLAPFKVSVVCSKYEHNSQQNGNHSLNTDDHCQNCLTPWQHGHYVAKTHQKCQAKNGKFKKQRTTTQSSFILVIKCLVCLNVTSSEFNKNKISSDQCIEKLPNILPDQKIEEVSKVKDELIDESKTEKKKPKKKKRNMYAGLNPLVFKNKNVFKTKLKNLL